MMLVHTLAGAILMVTAAAGSSLLSCPGYKASNVQSNSNGLTADLTLAGDACNAYGTDLTNLTLTVEHQTNDRLHIIIQDLDRQVYQVPSSVLPRPSNSESSECQLEFKYEQNPFSFSVVRKSNKEVLFDSSVAALVFESQYVRLRTSLPAQPSLYGLGESTDPFMLNHTNYTRTVWNRDAYGTPNGTNLYGDHPVYFDHRNEKGTHGVFLLNSNGMDVKINDTNGQYLEYNLLGGVLDFYFLAGPSPVEVAQQYADTVGHAAMMPYWGFGFHQCRYGMQDVYEVADVVYNYSAASIPLETMWTDIDYMHLRRVFTLDPVRFPLSKMRELVSYLHAHQQHYIVMVDPAVAYQTEDYGPFTNGVDADAFLKVANGSIYVGVVWPGAAEFPDWFAPGTQKYWDGEFASFFDPDTGVDIDALWIDMNEASNFCDYPCKDPFEEAIAMGDPPRPPPVRIGNDIELPGFPSDLQPKCHATVNFSVKATNTSSESIGVYGNVVSLGEGDLSNAIQLSPMQTSAKNVTTWSGTAQVPANKEIMYQFIRFEDDGTYVFEKNNRTMKSGDCGSSQAIKGTVTSDSPSPDVSNEKREFGAGSKMLVRPRQSQDSGSMTGLPGRDLINPPYHIQNAAGSLSNKTINTNIGHYGGWVEYDTHNLYGAMMSESSRLAMLNRRPTLRPMVITRSTFAGSGRQVGHWLGDNLADWWHYQISISGILNFAGLFQLPMVGSDVCGFGGTTNERLCARWAALGAFSPFYRNHGELGSPPHEFYRWGNDSIVAVSARNAIAIRYKTIDHIYTAMYEQNATGTPMIQPMFFVYPDDEKCNSLQYQYFWGSIMVAPVTQENSTEVDIYFPNDVFYDYYTHEKIQGNASTVQKQVPYTSIPLFYRGGTIVAERANSANTTTELRKQDFVINIAPGRDGSASGTLYLDDGVSLEQPATSYIHFHYSKAGKFSMTGSFGYSSNATIQSIVVLGKSEGGNGGKEATTSKPQESISLNTAYTTML